MGATLAGPCSHSLPTMPCPGCREAHGLKAPIYFSTGLTEKASILQYWHPGPTRIRKTFVQRNMFEFKHIKAFDRAFADSPGPMVWPWVQLWGSGGGQEFHQAQACLQGTACLCSGKMGGQKALRAEEHIFCPDCPPHARRSCLLPRGCCMLASHYRSSESGQGAEEHGEGLGPRAGSLGAGAALARGLLPLGGTGWACWCLRSDPG